MSSSSLLSITSNGKNFFIQSKFNDLSGCNIIISDCVNCWNVKLSNMMIEEFASEANLSSDEYLKMMKHALAGSIINKDYNYNIDQCEDDLVLEWKKTENEIKYCLGRFELKKTDTKEALQKILSCCCDQTQNLKTINESNLSENKTLNIKLTFLNEELQKCTELKEKLEYSLIGKFVLILNEKKSKIRTLQQQASNDKELIHNLKMKLARFSPEPDSPTTASITTTIQTPMHDNIKPNTSKNNFMINEESFEILESLPKRKRKVVEKIKSFELESPKKKGQDDDQIYLSDANTATTSADSTIDVDELIEDL